MLLFKGLEELHNVVNHSKQRHHIVGQYVIGQQGGTMQQQEELAREGISPFLKNFYNTNYSWSLILSCCSLFPQIKNYLKCYVCQYWMKIIPLVSDQTVTLIIPGLIWESDALLIIVQTFMLLKKLIFMFNKDCPKWIYWHRILEKKIMYLE